MRVKFWSEREFRSRIVNRWTVCLLAGAVATSHVRRLIDGSPGPGLDVLVLVVLVGGIVALIWEGVAQSRDRH